MSSSTIIFHWSSDTPAIGWASTHPTVTGDLLRGAPKSASAWWRNILMDGPKYLDGWMNDLHHFFQSASTKNIQRYIKIWYNMRVWFITSVSTNLIDVKARQALISAWQNYRYQLLSSIPKTLKIHMNGASHRPCTKSTGSHWNWWTAAIQKLPMTQRSSTLLWPRATHGAGTFAPRVFSRFLSGRTSGANAAAV